MTKIRTCRNYALLYRLEEWEGGFLISIEKSGEAVSERSAYIVYGEETDLKSLLCRLWRCGVTPLSLLYVLEDEGYIPREAEAPELKAAPAVVRRFRRETQLADRGPFAFEAAPFGALSREPENKEL